MTLQTQFIPRNYDVFAGLDVDKKSMAEGADMSLTILSYNLKELSI
jgi:hypothetical protein